MNAWSAGDGNVCYGLRVLQFMESGRVEADTVVIGAGVVGLAIARRLAKEGRDVVVVERERAIGTATSSRNSGVIHAGIYYPSGSNKARLCVRGNALLYEYCATRGVPHTQCGKLVVATSMSEIPTLRQYEQLAATNGVEQLAWLNCDDVANLEPQVRCVAALHSPSTGIVDVHDLMLALRAEIESHGGQIVVNTNFVRAEAVSAGFVVTLATPAEIRLTCRELVNSAGLDAPAVAANILAMGTQDIPRAYYVRGHYYAFGGKSPFRRLVYPMPEDGGLGIHMTMDMSGRVRFGPDIEWIDGVDYRFTADRTKEFTAAIRRYYPRLDDARLTPDFTGIRPRIYGPGQPAADFRIDGPDRHGISGLVNLFGIESPGLTSSLAIGDAVTAMLIGRPASI